MTEQKVERTVQGVVVSDKMNKSAVLLVERKVKHPVYGKYIKLSSKMHFHDEKNEAHTGDTVSIKSCRPLSKTKTWILVKVLETAK
jgi:small subunit ribosomal protein S17